MEALLSLLGTLIFMFLVLAAAVEVILENLRGILERIGFTWVRGNITLEESLKLAGEFAQSNTDLNIKLEAVKSAAGQISKRTSEKITELDKLKNDISTAGISTDVLAGRLNAIATAVKNDLEQNEHRRIFWLRLFATGIGCALVYNTQFYVFHMLTQAPEAKEFLSGLTKLNEPWINTLVGGLAAAAGSSYWHDQLDKIRSLKSAVAQVQAVAK